MSQVSLVERGLMAMVLLFGQTGCNKLLNPPPPPGFSGDLLPTLSVNFDLPGMRDFGYVPGLDSGPGVSGLIIPGQVSSQVVVMDQLESGYDCAGIWCLDGEYNSSPASQEGKAHWYGGLEYQGNITASGEIFDENALTAASWFYEFGTVVRVTNVQTGEYVDIRINDHGPDRVKYPSVIIDLSRAAFQVIAGGASGEITVRVDKISEPNN